jgi:hypothetical protein
MLAELVAGNRDAPAMSDLAQSKGRRKIPGLIEALIGYFDIMTRCGSVRCCTGWTTSRRP